MFITVATHIETFIHGQNTHRVIHRYLPSSVWIYLNQWNKLCQLIFGILFPCQFSNHFLRAWIYFKHETFSLCSHKNYFFVGIHLFNFSQWPKLNWSITITRFSKVKSWPKIWMPTYFSPHRWPISTLTISNYS